MCINLENNAKLKKENTEHEKVEKAKTVKIENLRTDFLGKHFVYFKSIDSTQKEIFRNIKDNSITNGKLILADIQHNGQRNTWQKMVHRRIK